MLSRLSFRINAISLGALFVLALPSFQSFCSPADKSDSEFTVVISEFVADNHSGLTDEDGDRYDWLELHNYGRGHIDLGSAYLTDSRKNLTLWQFPDSKLAAGEYLIVFLSGKDRRISGSPLHTNFSLDRKGDYLGLVDKDGKIIHDYARQFPEQNPDTSFGLSPDWSAEKSPNLFEAFLAHPTPGAENTESILGTVKNVKFNVKRGWHQESFVVNLRTKTRGAEIRYTLDGSLPSEENGFSYSSPISISQSTVLRATAFKNQHRPAQTTTRTYLFVEDVLKQSPDGLPPPSFPYSWGKNKVNYGMDPRIVSDPSVSQEIIDGFHSLPSFSIVMDVDDLFDKETGIYSNADRDGRESERSCSMELIHPDGAKGFQIDCGIRMRGGFSRSASNPKHSFRFFFRDLYGPSKLEYPLFGKSGADQFDHIDLRTFQNYAWHLGSTEAIFLRDQFCRDLQLDLGQPASRGEFCHLFLNGQYWGVYNTCERIKASYGAEYFGGSKSDYDSVKHGRRGVMTNDGNLESWKRLWNHAKSGLKTNQSYFEMLGRNPDGTENVDLECLLDVDNLIDYMLVIFYGGNYDGPVSAWGNNRGANNWYGLRNRESRDGFRFFIWDAEHSLKDVREDRTGPFPAGSRFDRSNPQWIWQQCLENEEFRVRVGDRIQQHFYNDGALTAKSVLKRFLERAEDVEAAALCESARWGDAAFTSSGGRGPQNREPRTRKKHWQPEIDRIANEYIPARSEIILAQLFGHGVISDVEAPKHRFLAGDKLQVHFESPQGTVYYTTDGTDPRLVGGEINPSSKSAKNNTIRRNPRDSILARTWFKNEWSALSIVP